MEARSKDFTLSDEEKSIHSHDALQPSMMVGQLQEVGAELEDASIETDIQVKYYLEYKKIYFTAFKLTSEIRKQIKLKDTLAQRLTNIETQLVALHKVKRQEQPQEEHEDCENDSKRRANKRTRRTAQEIERKYYCSAEFCDRCYGSEGSLQQHIKLKHPELYRRQNQNSES